MSKEAMKLALEMLKNESPMCAIEVLEEALAQPDQYAKGYADAMNWKMQNHLEHLPAKQEQGEPFAVMELYESGWDLVEDIDTDWLETLPLGTKLYTTPQQSKFLVLTQEEFENDKGA